MTAVDVASRTALVQPEASLSVVTGPDFTIARPAGDFDLATTPLLRDRLLSVLAAGGRLLIIDLSGVSFFDASALTVLIGTQRRARVLGMTVRLVAPRPQLAKLLRITGLDSTFRICATLDAPPRSGLARSPSPGFP